MSNYFSQYSALLSSAGQIDYCRQAHSLDELLARIKQLWDCDHLSDDELLGEITRLNQVPINTNTIKLAGHWLPYRYQPKRKQVNWLVPVDHATEPFLDEYISRCRQQLFNQIIQPCSSLEVAQQQTINLADVQPAGFIFHLSRCGSTLVSGCLSELESTCVFSEAPLLTELLLDSDLSLTEQQIYLRAFINLQAAAFPARPSMIIKWNAWDIFQWDLIRGLYPQVPVIFLVRDPVEILASHQRSAGRHMAQDLSLAHLHPVFTVLLAGQDTLAKRIGVLHGLLQAMGTKSESAAVSVVDYQYLNAQGLVSVLNCFGCTVDQHGFLKIQERMNYHSKSPGQVFVADNVTKQGCFTPEEQERIRTQLAPGYNQLNRLAHEFLGTVINVY